MSSRHHTRPWLEYLEDRTVPATVRLVSGTLLISNPTIMGSATALTLTQDAVVQNKFTVKDGPANNGTYSGVGNIDITGTNANDLVTINLKNNRYTGNLLVNSGGGSDSVAIIGGGAAGNAIGGNVTLVHGAGNESVNVNGVAGSGLTIGGSLTATNTYPGSHNTFQLGNTGAPTNVGGSVTLTNFADRGTTPAVQIGNGQFDTIGGGLSVQSGNVNNNVTVNLGKVVSSTLAQGVMIGNGFNVQTGAGNDTVAIVGANLADNAAGGTKTVGTTINGTTYISLGDGNNYFDVVGQRMPGAQIGGQETTFNGNVVYTAGNGNDSINLAGFGRGTGVGTTINGNLTISLGDGNNDFGDSVFAGGSNGGLSYSETTITGNLNLTSGNGNNVMDFYGINVQGTEAFTLGNGTNGTATAPILIRTPGSKLVWNSGNGNDYLQIASPLVNAAPQLFNVDIHFGNGDDTFQLGGVTLDKGGSITGTVDGGGRLTANVFLMDPTLWTIVAPFTITNFP
jgi:hypothetical protein